MKGISRVNSTSAMPAAGKADALRGQAAAPGAQKVAKLALLLVSPLLLHHVAAPSGMGLAIPATDSPRYLSIRTLHQLFPQYLSRAHLGESQDHGPLALLHRMGEGEDPKVAIAQHDGICR